MPLEIIDAKPFNFEQIYFILLDLIIIKNKPSFKAGQYCTFVLKFKESCKRTMTLKMFRHIGLVCNLSTSD